MADGERCLLSACGLFLGARLELRLTQGQSHRVSPGKRGWGLRKPWESGCMPVLHLDFQKQSLAGGRNGWSQCCWGPLRREIPFGLNLKKTPWKYKCSSCTSRVSGFQHQWDGDQTAFPWKAVIVFVIPRLLSFQPELFNIPWHLCITSVSASLNVMALAGSVSP